MKIGVTILAAGSSKRMGNQNKLLLLVNNKPILYILCKNILKADVNQVVLVTGYQKKKIENVLPNGIDTIVHNENWKKGMMSSIHVGISNLQNDIDANMIILGDMPLIKTNTINSIICAFNNKKGKYIVYPTYNNIQANPVIFPKKFFPEILYLKGDYGPKQILKKYPSKALGFPINSDEVILDCDTAENFSSLRTKLINNVKA